MGDGINSVDNNFFYTKLKNKELTKEDVSGTKLENIFDDIDKGGTWNNGVRGEEKSDGKLDFNEIFTYINSAPAGEATEKESIKDIVMSFLEFVGFAKDKEAKNQGVVTINDDGGYSEEIVDEDGNKHTTRYDSMGRSIEYNKFDKDGKIMQRAVRRYGEDGSSQKTTYDALGRSTYYEEIQKDGQKIRTATREYGEDGSSHAKAYNSQGKIYYEEDADPQKKVTGYSEYKYSDIGCVKSSFDKNCAPTDKKEFDAEGKPTAYVKKCYVKDESGNDTNKYTFVLYDPETEQPIVPLEIVEGGEDLKTRYERYSDENGILWQRFYDEEDNALEPVNITLDPLDYAKKDLEEVKITDDVKADELTKKADELEAKTKELDARYYNQEITDQQYRDEMAILLEQYT